MCADRYGWDFKTTNNQPYLLLLKMLNSTNEPENSPEEQQTTVTKQEPITGEGLRALFGGG
ncbi:hypothetical protein G6W75_09870 [Staphylococcus sciuri]|nr:hypothetical protein [Mammaliicoccus sciuri]